MPTDQSVSVVVSVIGSPIAGITGIRIHDNARGIWFNTYPEGQAAAVQPGAGNLYIVVGLKQMGAVDGNLWAQVKKTDGTIVIPKTIIWVPVGDLTQFVEKTMDMPSSAMSLIVEVGHD